MAHPEPTAPQVKTEPPVKRVSRALRVQKVPKARQALMGMMELKAQ